MNEKLTKEEVEQILNHLPGWSYASGTARGEGGSIKKLFNTSSCPDTMGFVTAIGGVCQRLNHHPEYVLMKYRELEVSFSTHSAGGVTSKDIEAAEEIEKIKI
jgi:4a-hydroxytetrahydrobiopterin dehydratase